MGKKIVKKLKRKITIGKPRSIGIVEALHEVVRWHSKTLAAGARALPPELASRLLGILPADDDPVHDLGELAARETAAIRAFNEDLGDVAKTWRMTIKDLGRDGLQQMAQDNGTWRPEDGYVSLSWLRVRILYAMQEARRHSFGLDTPATVAARIKFLDETKKLPGSFVDPITGESVGEFMTEASRLGAPEKKRRSRSSGGSDAKDEGGGRLTIKAFLSQLFKANLTAKKTDVELAKELGKAFPKKTWTTKDIRRKRNRYNRLEAGSNKVPEFGGKKEASTPKVKTKLIESKPAPTAKKKVVIAKRIKK